MWPLISKPWVNYKQGIETCVSLDIYSSDQLEIDRELWLNDSIRNGFNTLELINRLINGEHAQFMGNMPNLWWTCSIYGEHAQFMVNMPNLWWTCSIYGEHAQFMVNMFNLGWTCPI